MRALFVTCAFCACARSAAPAPPPPPPGPHVEVNEAQGMPPEKVQTLVAPAAEPLQRCMSGHTGKMTFWIRRHDGALDVTAIPSAALDPRARACALDALSSVMIPETGSNVGGPAVPPTGFTSVITFSW